MVIVAAPGPSLTPDVVEVCRGQRVVVVQDAYRLLPRADVLYGCDAAWWRERKGAAEFEGERWSSHHVGRGVGNDKSSIGPQYGLRLVEGRDKPGFSFDPAWIHYGKNSGFQAVNLALLMGASRVVLVGFDMHGTHFFGPHRRPLRQTPDYRNFINAFAKAAELLRPGIEIVNATPGSALKCFPRLSLEDAIAWNSDVASGGVAHDGPVGSDRQTAVLSALEGRRQSRCGTGLPLAHREAHEGRGARKLEAERR